MDLRPRDMCGIALLSAAALFLEVSLTRVLSVALWHHFAVMVVGCAVMGIAASGTLLSLRRRLVTPEHLAVWPVLFAASAASAFMLAALSPVDPYALVLTHQRLWLVPVYYLFIALPFLCAGMCTGTAYALSHGRPWRVYLADMLGASIGCLAASTWGGPTIPLAAALIGALAAPLLARDRTAALPGIIIALALAIAIAGPGMAVPLSPYKGLEHDLNYAAAHIVSSEWGPSSRVDVLDATRPDGGSPLRFAPGMSLNCPVPVPPQLGVYVDGEAVGGVPGTELDFTACLPPVVPLPQRPGDVLVLRPGAGLDITVALHASASSVTAVEPDHVLRTVLERYLTTDPRVSLVADTPRPFLARSPSAFDAILLTQGGRAFVSSAGLATLEADELLTTEGMSAALAALRPGGILVVTRYLHPVPRDSVKLVSTLAAALRDKGVTVLESHMAVFTSYSTYTVVASPDPLPTELLERIRSRCDERGCPVAFPGGGEGLLFRDIHGVVTDTGRTLAGHAFDVRPASDDRPFFARFFRLSRTSDLYRGGGSWEPLIEGGFIIPLMLVQALVLAVVLVVLPLRGQLAEVPRAVPVYFSLVGLAYMAVEVALIHRLLPVLDSPTSTLSVTLAALLASSGLGALLSSRTKDPSRAIAVLGVLCIMAPFLLDTLLPTVLALDRMPRSMAVVGLVAPLGLLMGVPFPSGLARIGGNAVPVAWALNGAASVVGSLTAQELGMVVGFRWAFVGAGCCYLAAWRVTPAHRE